MADQRTGDVASAANVQVRAVATGGASIWTALPYIAAYWTAAIGVILMNADILHKVHCPAALTAWHQFCCTVLVYLLWMVKPGLFDQAAPRLSAETVMRRIVPIAVLFALTLGVGNRAYMYLSVAFIQMVKAAHPVLTYVISCLMGVEAFRHNKLQATVLVTMGVVLSVTGELQFSLLGFGFQMFGSLMECFRMVLIGLLLSKNGLKLDPLTTISYVSPIALMTLVPMALATERPADFSAWLADVKTQVGFGVLLLNGLVAFSLNIAVVTLIGRTDPVVYAVVGVLKDILLVVVGGLVFATPVTHLQVAGYLLSLGGVQVYNMVQKNPEHFEKGLYHGLWALAKGNLAPPPEPVGPKAMLLTALVPASYAATAEAAAPPASAPASELQVAEPPTPSTAASSDSETRPTSESSSEAGEPSAKAGEVAIKVAAEMATTAKAAAPGKDSAELRELEEGRRAA